MAALAIGCLALYLVGSQAYDLLTDDEARYAEAGRRMIESGDWIVPEFNGAPRYQKPILYYWLQALAQAVLGSTLLAARLPTALAGTGVVLMTAALGRALWGPRAGLWSGLVLATTIEMVLLSRAAMTDVVLLLCLQGALCCLHFARLSATPTPWYLLACACCGFGLLAKGPVAVLLPLAIFVPWLVLRGETLEAARAFPWLRGSLIIVGIALPWYALAHWRTDGEFTWHFFVNENLGRFTANVNKHRLPVFAYVLLLVPMTFPWAGVLPQSVASVLRSASWRAPHREAAPWLLAWQAVLIVVLFTFSKTRVWTYTLPALPALALIVGRWLAAITHGETCERRALRWPALTYSLVATLAVGGAYFFPVEALPLEVRSESLLRAVQAGLGLLAALAWLLTALAYWGSPRLVLGTMVAGVVLFYLVGGVVVARALDQEYKAPVRQAARLARAHPSARLVTYFVHEHGLNFAAGLRRVDHWREGSLEDLRGLLAGPLPVLVLAPPERLHEFDGERCHVCLQHRRFVVLANFPPVEPCAPWAEGELAHLANRPNP